MLFKLFHTHKWLISSFQIGYMAHDKDEDIGRLERRCKCGAMQICLLQFVLPDQENLRRRFFKSLDHTNHWINYTSGDLVDQATKELLIKYESKRKQYV